MAMAITENDQISAGQTSAQQTATGATPADLTSGRSVSQGRIVAFRQTETSRRAETSRLTTTSRPTAASARPSANPLTTGGPNHGNTTSSADRRALTAGDRIRRDRIRHDRNWGR